jgi:hypothetical protein
MDNELESENIAIQLRAKLNRDKIKLWELPFYDNGPVEQELQVDLFIKSTCNDTA